MSRPERIGIFGGTFDPIHRTHVAIARTARDQARLDRVLFVIAASPPHKDGGAYASAADRLAMVRAAVAREPGMEASPIEIERDGPSYTIDTLRALKHERPNAQLFLILGEDSLVDLPMWREPDSILALARALVVPRPGSRGAADPAIAERVTFLPFRESAVSSSEVRRRIGRGEDVSAYILPEVERIIYENHLYHAARDSDTL